MIVYNITFKIIPEIEKDWVNWQQQEHIPDIMSSGYFSSFAFYKLLEQEETEGPTYVLQCFTDSMEAYEGYLSSVAPLLREKAFDKWDQRFIAFRTVMEAVH